MQRLQYRLAAAVIRPYDKPWLFPQILQIARRWRSECLQLKDDTFPQLLLLQERAREAADRIYRAIVSSTEGEKRLKPVLRPYDTVGSTRHVDFDTTRPVYVTRADKCHVSHVVADTESWEQKMAQGLEDMDEVVHYVKNQNLGFTIPYTLDGQERSYVPDFIVHVHDGHGMKMLSQSGVACALLSGRRSAAVAARAAELGLAHVLQGIEDKLAAAERLGVPLSQVGFMGDELVDLPVLTRCGFACAPREAPQEVRSRVHYVARAAAGRGAVREVCELVMRAQQTLDQVVQSYLG